MVDSLVYGAFVTAAVGCFSISSMYHLLGPSNKLLFKRLQALDLTSILLLILFSYIPPIYVAFSCEDHQTLRAIYISLITALVVSMLALSACLPSWNSDAFDRIRSSAYALIVLFAMVPAFHWAVVVPTSEAYFGLSRLLIGLIAYSIGFIAYMAKIPERYTSWNGIAFVGSSHNIWHIMTAFGTFWLLRSLIEYHDFKTMHGCRSTAIYRY